jgi:hypothetical protein
MRQNMVSRLMIPHLMAACGCAIPLALTAASACAQAPEPIIVPPVDESRLVTLTGNISSAALDGQNDRGRVDDSLPLNHMLLLLKRSPESEAHLEKEIDAMHDAESPEYHHWLSARQLGERFGAARQDTDVIRHWLESHGSTVNLIRQNGLVIDFSGTAGQVRETFHTEIHNLIFANGERHVANMSDPQIPAALAAAVEGIASLHDFFPRPHLINRGTVIYDRADRKWHPHFTMPTNRDTYYVVSPYDFATIYNLLPLWKRGYTGKGVTIATVEDSSLLHPYDWSTFRKTFGMDKFTSGTFKQVFPSCKEPGQNGDEVEADLDVEWASASAPDAAVELSACRNTKTTSGLDLAILGILETSHPPDIISDSYGLCETITGHTEIALENLEAEQASAEGVTYFIAQGDTGADECAPVERTRYSTLGINSGDNTASSYAVDVGGTDFQAEYNADVYGIPVSNYWSATNNPNTLAGTILAPASLYTVTPYTAASPNPTGPVASAIRPWAKDTFSISTAAAAGPAHVSPASHPFPAWSAVRAREIQNPGGKKTFPAFPMMGCVTSRISRFFPPMACGAVSMWNASRTKNMAAPPARPGTTRCWREEEARRLPRQPWRAFKRSLTRNTASRAMPIRCITNSRPSSLTATARQHAMPARPAAVCQPATACSTTSNSATWIFPAEKTRTAAITIAMAPIHRLSASFRLPIRKANRPPSHGGL